MLSSNVVRGAVIASFPAIAYLAYRNSNDNQIKLKQVHIFHRHGHRTPIAMLNKDVEAERRLWVDQLGSRSDRIGVDTTWSGISKYLQGTELVSLNPNASDDPETIENSYPENFMGRLTPKGAREMVTVGQWIRQRYVHDFDFLPKEIGDDYADVMYIRSTPYRRTIYSVDEMLQGLYPAEFRKGSLHDPSTSSGNRRRRKSSDAEESTSENGEPVDDVTDTEGTTVPPKEVKKIAIHVEPDKDLEFNWVSLSDRLTEIRQGVLQSVRVKVREKQGDLVRLSQYFHENSPLPFSWTRIQDALRVRATSNLAITKDVPRPDITRIFEHFAWRWNRMYDGKESQALAIGRVFESILDRIDAAHENPKELKEVVSPRLYVTSCHDTTLFLMKKLMTQDQAVKWPPYSAILVLEVWQEKYMLLDNDIYVRVLFNGRPVEMPLESHTVDDKKNLYTLRDFQEYAASFVPENWEEAEKALGPDPHPSTGEPKSGRGALLV